MKIMCLASAAALGLIAAPASAQVGNAGSEIAAFEMSDEQRAIYDSWPIEQRGAFDAWDADRQTLYFGWTAPLRGYYWDLEPEQQAAWWLLDDEQRVSLFQMDPAQRTSAWSAIMDQVEQAEVRRLAALTDTSVRFVRSAVVQSTPAAERPAEYPVCESDADDNCINPWAAGKRGAGVERPLGYWPGQPASSM